MERHAGSPARKIRNVGDAACGENYDAVSGCKTLEIVRVLFLSLILFQTYFTADIMHLLANFTAASLQRTLHADERVACSDEWVRQTFFPSCSASSHHGASQRRLYALDGL